MTEFATYVSNQGLIENSLAKGADMPLTGPSMPLALALIVKTKAAYTAEPNSEYKRANLNRALSMRRDLRMRIGRYGALRLTAAMGLRANFETGDRLA